MPLPRSRLALACALIASALAGGGGAGAEPPKIGKPRPAPPGPANMPPLPPAVIDETLEIGGDDVDARKRGDEAQRRGPGEPARALPVRRRLAAPTPPWWACRIAHDLELPLGTPVTLQQHDRPQHRRPRPRRRARAWGPSVIRDLQLPALREADLGGAGMIGIDALARQRLMMDFEKKLIRVEDASKPVKSMPGDIVVTARLQQGPADPDRGQGRPDHPRRRGRYRLADHDRQQRASRQARPEPAPQARDGHGDRGDRNRRSISSIARIDELRLGSVTLSNVPIAFADVPPFEVFGLADEPALLLGTDLLGTFRRVSLDFRARKVRFQLRRCQQGLSISTAPERGVDPPVVDQRRGLRSVSWSGSGTKRPI